MSDKKIGNIEAIALIITIMVNHIILNLPKSIIHSTSSGAVLNVLFISLFALGIAYLISNLLKSFPRFRYF